ncbi:MAG: DMT family transporter [Micavibrio sp.]|nr:DMT family transporter [Micavibrio sp.]
MFTLSHSLNKLLVGIHDPIEIAFWRNVICALPCLAYILVTKQPHLFKFSKPYTLAFRVIIGTIGLVFTLAAMQHLPVSVATVLFFVSTLLIPIMAHFFLKEYIGPHRWIAVIIGMSGVLLIARPSGEITAIGIAFALGAAFVHASIQVLIRAMKGQNPFTITLYFFVGGAIMLAFAMPFVWNTPTLYSVPILLLIGLFGGLGQYFLTRGFQMAPASLLGPFNYTGLIWASGIDIIIFLHIPSWHIYAGAMIIIAAQAYILYREKKNSIKRVKPATHSVPPLK